MNKPEIPVLVLSSDKNEFIVATTERFIRISDSSSESLLYSDFEGHAGYKSLSAEHGAGINIVHAKKDGHFSEFGLQKKDGQVIYWLIPTGKPGFAFWNVTNKCELIGRKYIIK